MAADVAVVSSIDLPDPELAFRFSSGRLCLSFCATVGERWRRSFERLRVPEDLGRWLRQAGVIDDRPLPVSASQLTRARELREAIYRLVRAAMNNDPGLDADLDLVNEHARRPTIAAQIGRRRERQRWHGPQPIPASLASIAADAVDLLTSSDLSRVRECAAPDCALLFLDTSRPGRRRWCASTACGSKARSAAYRARHPKATAH